MAFMQWSRELDTGISVIDQQHQRIVEFINELAVISSTSRDANEVHRVLAMLIEYTQTHFSYEEKLQERLDYPFLKAHRRVHDIFRRKVDEYQIRAQAGERVIPELLHMLKEWLAKHIKGDDAHYVAMIRSSLGNPIGTIHLAEIEG